MIGLKDQYFGVEVEMTGLTREDAARALAAYFGTEARYTGGTYGAWSVTDTKRKVWKLMSDSSIRAEHKVGSGYRGTSDSDYKVEMVTPKLAYSRLPVLRDCLRVLAQAGAKVNNSCGIHVHVDAADRKSVV